MKHTQFRRRAFFSLLAVLWAIGLVVTWGWFHLRRSAERPDGPVPMAGLSDSAYVTFDSLGIPTVRAETELDAWRTLGFLHATDRLWQLELFRRIAAGRLSELFGEPALETDRFVRTLGLRRVAAAQAEALGAEDRAALEAYAQGVNAGMGIDRPRPPEFQVLRFDPEPWTPEATLSVALVMNLDLSHGLRDLSRHWAAANLPPEKAAWLHPRYPDWGPKTLDGVFRPPAGTVTGFEATDDTTLAAARTTPAAAGAAVATPAPVRAEGPTNVESWDPVEVLSRASIRVASNAWVVGASRTANGHPILANDMHLALRAPPIWYVAVVHADADELHVAGFTLPGAPGVIAGFNRDVAWGITNAMADDMDFVIETLDESGRRYREGDRWIDLEVRPETIQVRGRAPVVDTVRSTLRGPLLPGGAAEAPGPVSVMFVPARAPEGLGGLLEMNRATSLESFQEAADGFTQPHLNLVVAGSDGRIGYRLVGSLPIRGWDGALPVTAERVGEGWPGFWPVDSLPRATAPTRDFLATANNLQAVGLDGAVGADWPVPFRAQRITQALAVRQDWTIESTAALQRDVRSLLADRTIARAIDAARRIGETGTAELLADWDRMVDVESAAAPIFYTWVYGLRTLVAADEWIPAPPRRASFPTIAMLRVLEEGDSPWVDDVRTPDRRETLGELEERAMAEAIRRVDGRRWGDVHMERHAHPLGTVPFLERLFGFDVGPDPSPGGPNTVRPDAYSMWNRLDPAGPTPPWVGEYGPSERLVVEMRPDGPRARLLIPTGQSGNPFSPHYRDMYGPWRAGELAAIGLEGPSETVPDAALSFVPATPSLELETQ